MRWENRTWARSLPCIHISTGFYGKIINFPRLFRLSSSAMQCNIRFRKKLHRNAPHIRHTVNYEKASRLCLFSSTVQSILDWEITRYLKYKCFDTISKIYKHICCISKSNLNAFEGYWMQRLLQTLIAWKEILFIWTTFKLSTYFWAIPNLQAINNYVYSQVFWKIPPNPLAHSHIAFIIDRILYLSIDGIYHCIPIGSANGYAYLLKTVCCD